MSEFDLVIRNGTVVDGSGGALYEADIGVRGGKIAAVGAGLAKGEEEIDAKGRIVTPGFVDIHTHFDGHATWADRLAPSSDHGVTTIVAGNCGVGFAPCRPEDRERLVALMEGIEDIPEPVLTEGLPWNWESFPDYLNVLERRRWDMDVATQAPHAPIRVHVMGERAANLEQATEDDIVQMRALAKEAIAAGALGFSTSRSINHRSMDGSFTPTLKAASAELSGIAAGLKDLGAGVLQYISDFADAEEEFAIARSMVKSSGRPLSMTVLQMPNAPDRWATVLDMIEDANRDGLRMKGQVCGRPVGTMLGLDLNYNPFSFSPSYVSVANLPLPARMAALRDAQLREKIIAEFPSPGSQPIALAVANLGNIFEIGERVNYEPRADDSIAARAQRMGLAPAQLMYDRLLADGGKTMFYIPAANYVGYSIDAIDRMIRHNDTLWGLGDGGAHCGLICDASLPTYMLTTWAKRTDRAPISLTETIRRLSNDTAAAVGLHDRGRIAVGRRADLNVIDFDNIALHRPEMVYDLPTGRGRLGQRADGYDATIVAGQITYRKGAPTGALPGRLVRGQQSAA